MPNDNLSFADLIEQAQKTPAGPGTGDISSPFGAPLPPDHRVVTNVEGKAPGVPEYDYRIEVHYFCIPHDKDMYEEKLNMVARGEAVIRFEKDSFNKEGDFITVLCLMIPTGRKKAKKARDKNLQEEEDDLIRRS